MGLVNTARLLAFCRNSSFFVDYFSRTSRPSCPGEHRFEWLLTFAQKKELHALRFGISLLFLFKFT